MFAAVEAMTFALEMERGGNKEMTALHSLADQHQDYEVRSWGTTSILNGKGACSVAGKYCFHLPGVYTGVHVGFEPCEVSLLHHMSLTGQLR